jgi:hypothetical protein
MNAACARPVWVGGHLCGVSRLSAAAAELTLSAAHWSLTWLKPRRTNCRFEGRCGHSRRLDRFAGSLCCRMTNNPRIVVFDRIADFATRADALLAAEGATIDD